jgi:C4-dicarboxylate-specific signal transduction histidine kinase
MDEIRKLHEKMDRIGEVLQVVAVQKNEIEHLVRTQEDIREWLKAHEKRLREVEQRPGNSASKFAWMLLSGGLSIFTGVSGAVITAFLLSGGKP